MITRKLQSDPTIDNKIHITDDGEVIHEATHDVSGIIRANKFIQNENEKYRSEVVNHVARIDVLAIKNWMEGRGITKGWWEIFFKDDKLLKEFLNDPDNKVWRTKLGKV